MSRHPAGFHATGSHHAMRGEWRKAEPHLRLAASNGGGPAARHALALTLMAQGRLKEGLPLYARRAEVPGLGIAKPRFPAPEWQGQDLTGKHIVVFPEQGLGDQIMFARYVPALKARAGEVTLICLPPLVRLFEQLGVRVLPAAGTLDFPEPDAWVMLADLPLRLRSFDLDGAPYLTAPPRGSGGVGLVRRGNPKHPNDAARSMPEGVEPPFSTLSLAPEDTGAADFLDTARIIAGLDAVVAVDTSVAHLAGAMGKRAFVILPAVGTDWRWGEESERTGWYDSLTLVRLSEGFGWSAALEEIGRRLRA